MKSINLLLVVILMFAACKKSYVSNTNDESSTSVVTSGSEDEAKITSVVIGTQTWMATNLNVTKYRNGDKIPQVKNAATWGNLQSGAWCYYNNDTANAIYGRLYNWYAVNDIRGLAPAGWHIATDAEWEILSNYLGGSTVAGGKLKESGTAHWRTPNTGATNSSGFTPLPGGWRNSGTGVFYNLNVYGEWWSATSYNATTAFSRELFYRYASFGTNKPSKQSGYSVRCVKD